VRPTRKKRIDDLMREVLSEILLTRASDPRLSLVTVTSVQISPELDVAKVFVSVMGDAAKRDEAMAALKRAAPFLRTELAKEVTIRRTPELRFLLDQSVERGFHMDSVLKGLADERAQREGPSAGGEAAVPPSEAPEPPGDADEE
jgi:ribosome-binding factor A